MVGQAISISTLTILTLRGCRVPTPPVTPPTPHVPYIPDRQGRKLPDGRPLPDGPATAASHHDHRHFPFKESDGNCPICVTVANEAQREG